MSANYVRFSPSEEYTLLLPVDPLNICVDVRGCTATGSLVTASGRVIAFTQRYDGQLTFEPLVVFDDLCGVETAIWNTVKLLQGQRRATKKVVAKKEAAR